MGRRHLKYSYAKNLQLSERLSPVIETQTEPSPELRRMDFTGPPHPQMMATPDSSILRMVERYFSYNPTWKRMRRFRYDALRTRYNVAISVWLFAISRDTASRNMLKAAGVVALLVTFAIMSSLQNINRLAFPETIMPGKNCPHNASGFAAKLLTSSF